MSDSYSYSYTGSYTGDYSYSYSYTDSASDEKQKPTARAAAVPARGAPAITDDDYYSYTDGYDDDGYSHSYSDSGTETAAPRLPPGPKNGGGTPTPSAALKAAPLRVIPAPPPVPPTAAAKARPPPATPRNGDTDSYSYSYSYSSTDGTANHNKINSNAKKDGDQTPAATNDSYYYYSDDYSYSDDYYYDDSYSYSDDYSYTGGSSYYYYSSSGTDGDTAPAVGRQKSRKTAPPPPPGGGSSSYYSDDYYYYSDDYYTGSDDSDYYSDSYYYTEDSYYYYSSDASSYSDGYYYDDSYSGSYTDSNDYYYSSSNYYDAEEDEESTYYYYSDDYCSSRNSSYTYSAESKSDSSTTSSYGYTSTNPSVMSVTETEGARDVLVLRTPTTDLPHAPPAPKRCFVPPKSMEDAVWAFLQRLMKMQQTYEARKSAATLNGGSAGPRATPPPASFVQHAPSSETAGGNAAADVPPASGEEVEADHKDRDPEKKKKSSEKDKKGKKKAATHQENEKEEEVSVDGGNAPVFLSTKENCFSERSLRIAFQVLRLNHLERARALQNAPQPLPMETTVDIYDTCVAARAKERVAQAFLALDPYRSGELSLTVMGGVLRKLGLGTSPLIEGNRISLGVSSDDVPEMVMHVEQLVSVSNPVAAAAEDNTENTVAAPPSVAVDPPKPEQNAAVTAAPLPAPDAPPLRQLQWEVTPVYVSRIVRKNAAAKKPTPIHWEHNTLYMGRHAIVRNVTNETLFQRLKTYIEAVTYLCVLANVFTIHDGERNTVTVQYPQFVRSILLAEPPASRHQRSALKLLFIENLFRAVFHPMEVLQSYEAGRGFPRYLHDWALESTLYSTHDTEEKRRRNVMPGTTADHLHFVPTPPTRPPTEVQLAFLLQKVRVPGKTPATARCFCLVSAITPTSVFLPAIEVPVRNIVTSSKEKDTATWVFYDKKHKKSDTILLFAGQTVDRIYVECCYETTAPALPCDETEGGKTSLEEAEQEKAAAPTIDGTAVTTVWCAGYAVFGVECAKTAALPVSTGSLLQANTPLVAPTLSPGGTAAAVPAAGAPAAGEAAPPEKAVEPKQGFFACTFLKLCKRPKKDAPITACNIKVEIMKTKKQVPGVEKLPSRFIAYQRHVPMLARLRTAVEDVGKGTAHALQALRQQAVRCIFTIAADGDLLDQLCTVWTHRTHHWSKTERKNEKEQQAQLLRCVAALYALNNCCAESREHFARSLIKKKPIQISVDVSAPLQPVRV